MPNPALRDARGMIFAKKIRMIFIKVFTKHAINCYILIQLLYEKMNEIVTK